MSKEVLGKYREVVLFCYSIDHMLKKDKIRFYYALKGRDGKSGVAKDYNVEQLGRAVLLVNKDKSSNFEDFLKLWKCSYEAKEVLIKK